jgi:hypothetical protein
MAMSQILPARSGGRGTMRSMVEGHSPTHLARGLRPATTDPWSAVPLPIGDGEDR